MPTMEPWKYHGITSLDLDILDPISAASLDIVIQLLDLPDKARVLDIACGKAEPLIRIAERYPIQGEGVDLSPLFLQAAKERANLRVPPHSRLTFEKADGAQYAAAPGSYDLAMCLGASWVWAGHRGTLKALSGFARPGGLVLVGEPYWRKEPPKAYLEEYGVTRETYGTHQSNVKTGMEEGLTFLYARASTEQEWDHYEWMRLRAAERYAARNPGDPDVPELLKRARHTRDIYLRWGRDCLGWAIYLFQKP